jgi:hypothetical protein
MLCVIGIIATSIYAALMYVAAAAASAVVGPRQAIQLEQETQAVDPQQQ